MTKETVSSMSTGEGISSTSTNMYIIPRKCILTKEQMEAFQASKTHQDVIGYIETLNDAVSGVKLTDECEMSEVCVSVHPFSFKSTSFNFLQPMSGSAYPLFVCSLPTRTSSSNAYLYASFYFLLCYSK